MNTSKRTGTPRVPRQLVTRAIQRNGLRVQTHGYGRVMPHLHTTAVYRGTFTEQENVYVGKGVHEKRDVRRAHAYGYCELCGCAMSKLKDPKMEVQSGQVLRSTTSVSKPS